jgi:response regulator RpfG family c-di-GMP phosphodiesterase
MHAESMECACSVAEVPVRKLLRLRSLRIRDELRAAADLDFLHDFGEVYVDERVLRKPGKLSPTELEQS